MYIKEKIFKELDFNSYLQDTYIQSTKIKAKI